LAQQLGERRQFRRTPDQGRERVRKLLDER
jgi:hypothetical protein